MSRTRAKKRPAKTKAAQAWADRVLAVRQRLRLTQEELAAQLDVSFATVNRWENGHTRRVQRAKMKALRFLEDRADSQDRQRRASVQSNLEAASDMWGSNRVLRGLANLQRGLAALERDVVKLRDEIEAHGS